MRNSGVGIPYSRKEKSGAEEYIFTKRQLHLLLESELSLGGELLTSDNIVQNVYLEDIRGEVNIKEGIKDIEYKNIAYLS